MRNRNNNTGRPIHRRAEQFTNFPAIKEPIGLMDFLITKGNLSRNKVKTLLSHRVILVDKKITTQYDFELRPGMLVQMSKKHNQKEFKSTQLKLIYEDAYLIVVDKREGLLAVGSEKQKEMSAFKILDDYIKRSSKQRRIYGVHRLDREASGLMIFAKDERTKQNLQDNWRRLVTERAYVAILEGEMEKENGAISSWLANDQLYVAHAATNNAEGDKAITYYTTIKKCNGYTLVELDLGNGYKEQIRTHMQELGHPVVGDAKSNIDNNPLKRLALHAFLLRFHHPVTGELLNFEIPYPSGFRKLVQRNVEEE